MQLYSQLTALPKTSVFLTIGIHYVWRDIHRDFYTLNILKMERENEIESERDIERERSMP